MLFICFFILIINPYRNLTCGFDISKDMKFLVSGQINGEVLIWKINSADKDQNKNILPLSKYYNHTGKVTCVKFSNKYPILLSSDANVNVWYPKELR